MRPHRLDPLLRPQSVAIIGASTRPGSVGHTLIRQIRHGGFQGRLYPVNPRYQEIEGYRCFPSLAALPEVPQHVAFAVPNAAVEEALEQAIQLGVRAGTMVSSLYLEGDSTPPLTERIRARCRAAG